MTKSAWIAAAAACALCTAMAQANPPAQADAIEKVSYTDLDLASPRDQVRLKRRIRSAAMRVCLDYERPSPSGRFLIHSCYVEAMHGAMRQVDQAIAEAGRGERMAARLVAVRRH